jgi:type IV pilus assembly protein PilC
MKKIKTRSGAFLSAFCTELALIIETGIPISDGLLMLIDDEEDDRVKSYLTSLYKKMNEGGSCHALSTAAAAVGGFPKYAVDMFVIGEKTGRLDSVLRSLSVYYDRDTKIKESVKSAVVFPIVLFTLLLGVMWVLLTQVLPVFETVFEQIGVTFNSAASTFMRIGGVLERGSIVILAVFLLSALLIFVIYKTDKLREAVKGTFAVMFENSKLMQNLLAARFSASMAMTLKSGLDIDESLELAMSFAPNKQSAEKIARLRDDVSQGKTFNEAVLETRILSPVYCRMLALSFKTGSTDEIMELIAQRSEEEAAVSIETLIGRIEPAMAFIMSVMIGAVLLSVMFPLLAVMGA